jgi:hypothetical protein
MRHETFAIGCAAGCGGHRTDAAAPIVETLIARRPLAKVLWDRASGLKTVAD